MSDDELEKLAAEMQNIQPSMASRKEGMAAAMAAFDLEFGSETAEITVKSEENIEAAQGLADAPRPTGQITDTGSVQTFGSDMMAKINNIFTFKPRTMMLAGSCMAALFAGMVIMPNMSDLSIEDQLAKSTPSTVSTTDITDEVAAVEQPSVTAPAKQMPTVKANEAITQELSVAETAPVVENKVTPPQDTKIKPPALEASKASTVETPSNVVVIERQVLKTPGRVEERVQPALMEPVTKRADTQVERREWRQVPLTSEDAAKGRTESFAKVVVPPQYETSSEMIVVRQASKELIKIPPVFETVKETIRINADGSTDILSSETVPTKEAAPTSHNPRARTLTDKVEAKDTVKEPVQSPTGIVAEAVQPPSHKSGITAPQQNRVSTNPAGQFTVFNGISNQVVQSTQTQVSQTGEILARVQIPAKYKTVTKEVLVAPARKVERHVPAVTKDITVKLANEDGTFREETKSIVLKEAFTDFDVIPPVYETRSERVLVAPARQEWKPGSQAINGVPAPVVAVTPTPASEVTSVPAAVTTPKPKAPSIPVSPLSAPAPVTTLLAEAPAFKDIQKIKGFTLEAAPPEFETVTETIVVQPQSVEYETVPATYENYTESVVVQEASTELVTIPAEYEWVEGDIDGTSVEYVTKPAEYETVTETVVVQPASVEYVTPPKAYETVTETIVVQPQYLAPDGSVVPAVTQELSRRVVKTPASSQERVIPAITKEVTRRVVKTPATLVERVVPYEKKDGKTRVVKTPAKTVERVVPNIAKQETRRRIRQPAGTQEKVIPGVTKEVQVKKLVRPQTFYLRNEDGKVVREFASLDEFEQYKSNLPTPVQEKPVSTFSVDVDTASYSFMRASINRGKLPPRDSIRLEELINYFPYDYEAPKSADEPFKANVTVTPTPWNADTKLMHIGIKGYVPPANEKPRSNLVFLIDVSGSMKDAKKLPLLVNSFKLLLGTLDANDTVSIVTYSATVNTALEPTRANEKDKIHDVLNSLSANGGTAGAAGLQLAYAKAEESFDEEGVNRVILATDGDFNIGFSSPEEMKTFIEEKRETGIFLSVLGFGMGNYKDNRMQALAQNGNGVAAYIDTLAEANKVLANEAGSALITIAKDVKIQVEFNPDTISEYRLIGYETRALNRQDFNNDKVDAGEIGAGHSVTAIYELTPAGSQAITNDPLRYVTERLEQTTGSDEFAFVKIRHKLPNADKSTLQTFPIGKGHERRLRQASDDMRFAAAVAAVGQKLRGNAAVDDFSYQDAIKLAKRSRGEDENGYRNEFIQLVRLIDSLEK